MKPSEKYLIVSLGSIGRRHLKNLRTLKPDAIIAIWRRHSKFNVQDIPEGANFQFGSLGEVLEYMPDVAIIAGPSSQHLETALSLAKADIHLLIEKPIANRIDGLDELIGICNQRQLVLMIGYNLRFYPSLKEVKRMVDDLVIGRVLSVRAEVGQYLPDWRSAEDYRAGVTAQQILGGGVLLELSHELDYIYWIFGMPDMVTARGGHLSDLDIDVEDTVELMLEYKSQKRIINIHLDMVERAPLRKCRLIGEKGTIVWDAMADRIEYFSSESKQWQVFEQFRLDDRNQMYLDELTHFFDCIDYAREPLITGKQGRDVMLIVDAAKSSMSSGRTIEMKQYE
ncbi:MAG: Gfo/Idh/MocA family protein [Methylophilaceae bacterium]